MKRILTLLLIVGFFNSCDLNEQVLDTPVGEGALQGGNTGQSALAPVYANYRYLYGRQDQLLNLQSISSDEGIVPFRGGTDWFDGGRYIQMHQHAWTSTHVNVTSVWSLLTEGIAKAAYARKVLADSDAPNVQRLEAEARAMGAFYNLLLLDLYGVTADKNPEDVGEQNDNLSTLFRAEEAVNYILSELNASIPDLGTYSEVGSTRFTKAAAWAFKAKLFLNKGVYVDRYADQYQFESQDMDSVIQYASRVIETGDYALVEDYFSIWNVDNHDNREHVFAFEQTLENGGSNRLAYFPASRATQGSLTHLSAQGTDAYALTTRMLNNWDGHRDDPRFFKRNLPKEGTVSDENYQLNRGIQLGQQYGIVLREDGDGYRRAENGELMIMPLVDFARSGAMVNYTPEVGLTTNNQQVAGARPWKFAYDPEATTHAPARVDFPVMRIAELYYMRAEATLRKGGNAAEAMSDINTVRLARRAQARTEPLDLEGMELERIFEFYYEWHRRTDQIRFGRWEETWTDKTNSSSHLRVFPIPQDVIDAASNESGYLEQNEGY